MKYVYVVYRTLPTLNADKKVLGTFENLRQARKYVRNECPYARLIKRNLRMGLWFYEQPVIFNPYGKGKVAVDIYRYKKDMWESFKKCL